MELSKLKHLQRYINSVKINYRIFELYLQKNQLSIDFEITTEQVFGTI